LRGARLTRRCATRRRASRRAPQWASFSEWSLRSRRDARRAAAQAKGTRTDRGGCTGATADAAPQRSRAAAAGGGARGAAALGRAQSCQAKQPFAARRAVQSPCSRQGRVQGVVADSVDDGQVLRLRLRVALRHRQVAVLRTPPSARRARRSRRRRLRGGRGAVTSSRQRTTR